MEELVPAPDPAVCCERFEGLAYRLFLDSAARGTRRGRYSFLAADPVLVVRSTGAHTECFDAARGTWVAESGDALAVIRRLLLPFRTEHVAGLPPFQGGAAGYLAYDWGRVLERLPTPRHGAPPLPDAVLGVYDWVLAWDHDASRAWLISTGLPERSPDRRKEQALSRADRVRRILRRPPRDGATDLPAGRGSVAESPAAVRPPSHLRSSFTRLEYLDAVARVRDYIVAGDIFQANISQRFEAPLVGTPWELYRRMRLHNAAPFAAYIDLPDAAIVSASPERFLSVDAEGLVETRPIKGTRPRGIDAGDDAALGRALVHSAKDRAENLMIVDLMRNDLSRVCAPGTVRATELFALERYATVQHLVSTIVGRLAPGKDALDLVGAAFPGGSITGAPKLRAMEIIAELEPVARGIYCGAIGYWSLSGELDTSIAIRTAVACHGRVYFGAGGAIVADSDPEQEYRETLDKARGIIDQLAPTA